jgi:hypothetical protein
MMRMCARLTILLGLICVVAARKTHPKTHKNVVMPLPADVGTMQLDICGAGTTGVRAAGSMQLAVSEVRTLGPRWDAFGSCAATG